MTVAESAVSAGKQQPALARPHQVMDDTLPVFVENLGADRHPERGVLAVGTRAHFAAPGLSVPGDHMPSVPVIDQCVQTGIRLNEHAAAVSAVAAVRASELDELLPPEADRTGPSRPRTGMYFGQVNKLHRFQTRPSAISDRARSPSDEPDSDPFGEAPGNWVTPRLPAPDQRK